MITVAQLVQGISQKPFKTVLLTGSLGTKVRYTLKGFSLATHYVFGDIVELHLELTTPADNKTSKTLALSPEGIAYVDNQLSYFCVYAQRTLEVETQGRKSKETLHVITFEV
jgi:hypothetical protein